jgi:hypothetical protein
VLPVLPYWEAMTDAKIARKISSGRAPAPPIADVVYSTVAVPEAPLPLSVEKEMGDPLMVTGLPVLLLAASGWYIYGSIEYIYIYIYICIF